MFAKLNKHHYFSKKEIEVIAAALLVYSYEIGEKIEEAYLNDEKISFLFSSSEIESVRDWFLEVYRGFQDKKEATEKIQSFLLNHQYRLAIVYKALNKCGKNFEKYKISNLGTITKEELHLAFEIFKELFPELESQESSQKAAKINTCGGV